MDNDNKVTNTKLKSFHSRKLWQDKIIKRIFQGSAVLAALMIVFICYFVISRGVQPFLSSYGADQQSLISFIAGNRWRPDISPPVYGVGFIIINTLLTSIGAAIISFPISVLTALFIAKIAPAKVRIVLTTIVELLAAIPSIVYGVFAAGAITGIVDDIGGFFGISTFGGNSTLAVILLLAIMIFPTITSLSLVAIRAVDYNLELGSIALGASHMETNFKVVLTSAKSGIFAGLALGLGRAFGEATAVSMVAGNRMIGPTWHPFEITRTLTTTILTGMHETSPGLDYDMRFSVGIILLIVILITNLTIQLIKKKIGGVSHE
ncbi:MAG TPA: phosphate ABC transporter permease subunit PstC [Clostridiaceae bacterium]|nr:phosphate ABC transporter permease subunit PstC [Clostridiaceae bacterium]